MSRRCRKVFSAAGALALLVAVSLGSADYAGVLPDQFAKAAPRFIDVRPAADFKGEAYSADARIVADWMLRNNKHESGPFMVADKAAGVVYAFDGHGVLIAKSAALYGKTRSDRVTEKQAAMPISRVTNADKVTPAGLFRAKGVDTIYGRGVAFAEYATTRLSIHQVYLGNKAEHRQARLQSTTLADHRVTFGCINVPAEFIRSVVLPYFGGDSVIAVLPEERSAGSFFGIELGETQLAVGAGAVLF